MLRVINGVSGNCEVMMLWIYCGGCNIGINMFW